MKLKKIKEAIAKIDGKATLEICKVLQVSYEQRERENQEIRNEQREKDLEEFRTIISNGVAFDEVHVLINLKEAFAELNKNKLKKNKSTCSSE